MAGDARVRFVGRSAFLAFKYNPQALQIVEPEGDLRHNGVIFVPQFLKTGESVNTRNRMKEFGYKVDKYYLHALMTCESLIFTSRFGGLFRLNRVVRIRLGVLDILLLLILLLLNSRRLPRWRSGSVNMSILIHALPILMPCVRRVRSKIHSAACR